MGYNFFARIIFHIPDSVDKEKYIKHLPEHIDCCIRKYRPLKVDPRDYPIKSQNL